MWPPASWCLVVICEVTSSVSKERVASLSGRLIVGDCTAVACFKVVVTLHFFALANHFIKILRVTILRPKSKLDIFLCQPDVTYESVLLHVVHGLSCKRIVLFDVYYICSLYNLDGRSPKEHFAYCKGLSSDTFSLRVGRFNAL
jgi:hypothetical protein